MGYWIPQLLQYLPARPNQRIIECGSFVHKRNSVESNSTSRGKVVDHGLVGALEEVLKIWHKHWRLHKSPKNQQPPLEFRMTPLPLPIPLLVHCFLKEASVLSLRKPGDDFSHLTWIWIGESVLLSQSVRRTNSITLFITKGTEDKVVVCLYTLLFLMVQRCQITNERKLINL